MEVKDDPIFDFYKKPKTDIIQEFVFLARTISGSIYPIKVFMHSAEKIAWNMNGPQELVDYSIDQIEIMENGGVLNGCEGGHLKWHVHVSMPEGQYVDFFDHLNYHGQSFSLLQAYSVALNGISRYLHDYKNNTELGVENIYYNDRLAAAKRHPHVHRDELNAAIQAQ